MRLCSRTAALLYLAASPVFAGSSTPLPVGGEFQVNSYTTNNQSSPRVASDSYGYFVVIWTSTGSSGGDASGSSVQGQRYAVSGAPEGSQFQINSYATSSQSGESVAWTTDGNFVAVWLSAGSSGGDTSDTSIQGQRFSPVGVPLGGQFQVNSFTTGSQYSAAVSLAAADGFVVVWTSLGSSGGDGSLSSAQGQRFSATGTPLGSQFQVNSYTTLTQNHTRVSSTAAGDFVVVWESEGSGSTDTSLNSSQGQRYSAGGTPLGSQFQLNTYTPNHQLFPAVASTATGDFVAVWQSAGSNGSDNSSFSVQGQRYSADGTPLGSQFQVNTFTTNTQSNPTAAADADGDFVVVWRSNGASGSDTSLYSVQGQRYAASGVPLGGDFQVNTYTTGSQQFPEVAASADGDFVVVWMSQGSSGSDNSLLSVQGQRYRVTGDLQGLVFLDQNLDGLWDNQEPAIEPGVAGVTVELYDESLTLRRTVVTNGAGYYSLKPKEGNWYLRFVAPAAAFTLPNIGNDDTIDSDATPATGETALFPIAINILDTTVLAGFVQVPLFWDGFESGGTSLWSATGPPP